MAFISNKKTFLKAAETGDMDELNYCLSYKAGYKFNIDVKNEEGLTALHLAADNGRLEAVRALIEHDAPLEAADNNGRTPLLRAVTANHPAIARVLIAAGSDVNTHEIGYATPLIEAARLGQMDVVKDLVAAHADINAVSKKTGRTPLHWAAENGHAPVVEFLLSQNPRTDIADRAGLTAQATAEKLDLQRIVKLFPKADAAPVPALAFADLPAPANTNDSDGWTLMGPVRVAQIGHYPAANRKITEMFNFESRERMIITENLKTGAETTTQPEKFDTLAADAVARAEEQWKALGGALPDKSKTRTFKL